ncbi:bifunctional (p)ppGpp synthetase/guanosine-3',5'-bis(diphosphate) 3'-pyrophosphohydrolase [Limibaculum sp. M0105]|uniref:GTP pyrophosphokinase rsh n=1 Tax=Thermohalobaculum xanthum TaxID=2753746 RepID=A0A8J7SEW1_9RHOB|nr:bifunctional (p)ppGpp synthetase/guanosine-3',5'-bis(diphosphate) 3'-pyrophosphohydrolase [Thermohalobaculum xanthum]MBK0400063.1 bifunctional (p)ppGpp synthetase/guanosine-3',5'-bis(diphosphate) 3'-pyrophosphohydrolase [Thermohalobaculum xanthum]
MIRQYELVEKVRDYNPNTDEALLNRAYVFGATAHANQRRASGEPYWGHPLEVASILTDLRLDDSTIVTALLHDTVEDTPATSDEIARLFGEEIAGLVDGVTKLTKLEVTSTETAQAENFRKLLLAMAKDVRVILVKLADRLHNMRTLDHLKPEKRRRIAQETMDIYAPLAGRMGMQSMREELEDLAFEVLNPEARTSIMRRFLKLRRDSGDLIPKISAELSRVLAEAGIEAEVRGREKKPYSIWRKMEEKQISFSQLSDIYGFRVIVTTDADCYAALGAIHRHWRAVPGRFKDYISGPKANGYRSIHTTVSGPGAARVEMQIRTWQMHAVAETGVAAHWAYRDGERVENPFAVDPYSWLRDLLARIEAGNEPQEFLEHVKLDMFTDQVFCFTPKGEVVGLPRGATPIDFAYAIHTRIGERCAGALVDGRRVPLWTRLRNGQQVEIITAEGQRPSPHWEDMAKTGRAKHAIRRALRDRQREEELALGRDLIEQTFARRGREGGAKAYQAAAVKLGQPSVEAMLVQLARGELSAHQVYEAIYPSPNAVEEVAPEPAEALTDPKRVRGVSRGAAVIFCQTCLPVPGERIIGLARRGGVVVHEMSCPILEQHEADLTRWHDLRWSPDASRTPANLARIDLTLLNQPGTLGKVCTLVGEQNANIDNIGVSTRKPDFFLMTMDIEVRDLRHLNDILTSLRAQSFVNKVERARHAPPPGQELSVDQPRLPLGTDPAAGA